MYKYYSIVVIDLVVVIINLGVVVKAMGSADHERMFTICTVMIIVKFIVPYLFHCDIAIVYKVKGKGQVNVVGMS